MAKTFTFRLTAEGVDQFRKDLEALGIKGDEAFQRLSQSSPQLENALKRAQDQAAKTKETLESLGKDPAPGLKALGAAGDELAGKFDHFAGRIPVIGAGLQSLGPAGAAAAAGIGAVAALLTAGAAEAGKYEQSLNRVQGVLRATANQSGVTARDLARLAEEMENTTNATEEGVLDAAGALATFRGISGATFTEILKRGQDMAALFGGDLRSNALTIARTFQNISAGEAAGFAKSFAFIGAEARGVVEALMAVGDHAGAARVFMESLSKTVAGAGAADRSGLTGAMKGLGDAWGDFLKEVGKTQGFMTDAVNAVTRGVRTIQESMTPEGQLRSVNRDIAAVEGRQSTGVGNSRLAGGRNRADLERLRGAQTGFALDILDREDEENRGRNLARVAGDAATEQDAAAALRVRTKAIDEFNAAQKRQLEIAGQVSAQREQAAAADKAEAELRRAVKDATTEEVAAARAAAVAITERRQATEAAAQAEKDIKTAIEASTKAEQQRTEKQIESFATVERQAEAIRRETEVIGLDDSARRVLAEVMQAENELRKQGIDLLSTEAEERIGAVRAAAEEREAKRKIVETQKDALAEAKRLAERSTDSVVRYIGDKFADVFSKTKGGWREVWQDAVTTAKAAMLRIAAEAVIRPIIAPIVGNMFGDPTTGGASTGNSLASLFGFGTPSAAGGAASGGSGLGQAANLLPNPSSFFGSGSGTLLNNVKNLGRAIPGLFSTGAGAGGASGFGFTGALADATIEGVYLGGATSGVGGAGLSSGIQGVMGAVPVWGWIALAASIAKQFVGGSDPRSAKGVINTLLAPSLDEWLADPMRSAAVAANPIGTAIGDLSGNRMIAGILNPLTFFGKKPGFSGGSTKIGIDANGQAIYTGAGFKRFDQSDEAIDYTRKFVDTVNQANAALGLRFAEPATSYFTGIGFGQGASPAERALAGLYGHAQVRSGDAGLDAKIASYFQRERETPSGDDANALMQSLSEIVGLHKLFTDNPNPLQPEQLTQVAQALKQIGATFDELKPKVEKYGYSLAQLEEMRAKAIDQIRTGFNEAIELQILGFTDPMQQALKQLEITQAQRLKEAKDAGADLVEVERLSGLERERLLRQSSAAIKDLLTQLTGTTASPLGLAEVLGNAEGRFNAVRSRVLGGEVGARDELAQAARDLLDVSRQAFSSSPQFFERFDFVVKTLQNIVGTSGFASGTDHAPPGWHWVGERGRELINFRGGEQVLPNGVRPMKNNARPDLNRGQLAVLSELRDLRMQQGDMLQKFERTSSQVARMMGRMMARK